MCKGYVCVLSCCVSCVCVCGSLCGSGTEQCAATSVTPHRVRLVPADRACKVIGFPVRWFHTFITILTQTNDNTDRMAISSLFYIMNS